jgi:hypothetical protein
MRTHGFGCLLLGMSLGVTACDKQVTPQEVESLLAASNSHATYTAHVKCQDGERDWVSVCDMRYEPTALGMRQGLKPIAPQRGAVRRMGTHAGKPILAFNPLPDGPVPSQEEYKTWQSGEMERRKAAAAAHAAKVQERSNRSVGR